MRKRRSGQSADTSDSEVLDSDEESSIGEEGLRWTGFKRNVHYLPRQAVRPGQRPANTSRMPNFVDLSRGDSPSNPVELLDEDPLPKVIELSDSDDDPVSVEAVPSRSTSRDEPTAKGKERRKEMPRANAGSRVSASLPGVVPSMSSKRMEQNASSKGKGREITRPDGGSRQPTGTKAMPSPALSRLGRKRTLDDDIDIDGPSSSRAKRPVPATHVVRRHVEYDDDDDETDDNRTLVDAVAPLPLRGVRGRSAIRHPRSTVYKSSSLLTPPASVVKKSQYVEYPPSSPEPESSDGENWYHMPGFEPLQRNFFNENAYTRNNDNTEKTAPKPVGARGAKSSSAIQYIPPVLYNIPQLIIQSGTGSRRTRVAFEAESGNFPLRERFSFMKASGAINSIAQSPNGVIAVAAAAIQGDLRPSEIKRPGFRPDPYNHSGNVLVWDPRVQVDDDDVDMDKVSTDAEGVEREDYGRFLQIPDGHSYKVGDEETHYSTVLEVAFDPLHQDRFITSSADGVVARWQPNDMGAYEPVLIPYPARVHAILYHPTLPQFAVGCFNGKVYIESPDKNSKIKPFNSNESIVGPSKERRQICHMAWGHGSRVENLLFFSVEGHKEDKGGGVYAFDCRRRDELPSSEPTKERYRSLTRWFPEVQGGGALLALNSLGNHMAISASCFGKDTPHALYLYELFSFKGRLMAEVSLPEATTGARKSHHIMDVQWSPDDRCVAIARDDNTALIYDIRSLTRPLHTLVNKPKKGHRLSEKTMRYGADGNYGIPNLSWISQDIMITGGNDGHLLQWHTNESTEGGGYPLAQLDAPVASISFGTKDGFYRPAIVAGDMDGRVYVYDFSRDFC